MPPALYLSGPCEICEQPAHGNHFGVLSCRACAAFFRRAALQNAKYQDRVCRKGNCIGNDLYRCKICRLKKCCEVGMNSSKFQNDRDLISSSLRPTNYTKTSAPQSLANFLGRPEFILCCEPDKASSTKRLVDVTSLVDKAWAIFQEDAAYSWSPNHYPNSLEKLTFEMEEIKLKESSKKLEIATTIGRNEALLFLEQSFLGAAQWFARLPEFSMLDPQIKIDILKTSWMIWARLDKLAATADFHRQKLLGNDVYMWTDNTCMNPGNVKIDIKWSSNYSVEQLRGFLVPDIEKYWRHALSDLVELDPTNVELNFMLIQLCLNSAGQKYQGHVLEATEKILQIQSDNMHEYYTKKLKLVNYSGRLARLMKINRAIEADVRDRKEKNHIAKVFDLFFVEYSHPEMFEFS